MASTSQYNIPQRVAMHLSLLLFSLLAFFFFPSLIHGQPNSTPNLLPPLRQPSSSLSLKIVHTDNRRSLTSNGIEFAVPGRSSLHLSTPQLLPHGFAFDFTAFFHNFSANCSYLLLQSGSYSFLYITNDADSKAGHLAITLGNPYETATLSPAVSLSAKEWYHIAVTLSKSGAQVTLSRLNVQGSLSSYIASGTVVTAVTSTLGFCIPGDDVCGTSYIRPSMVYSDLRVWNGTFDYASRDIAFR